MFKRSDTERTPKELADRAIMRTLARLGACALLIYFVVKLLLLAKSGEPGAAAPVAVLVVLMVLAAAVIVFTVIDFIRNLKTGAFNVSTYEEADIARYRASRQAENDNADKTEGENSDSASESEDDDDN